MNGLTNIRIDLGIDAQKIVSQIMIDNRLIENQIKKGIELALKEVTEEDNFIRIIANGTKESINNIIKSATHSWEFKSKIEKAINSKIEGKIQDYAEKVAEQVLKNL